MLVEQEQQNVPVMLPQLYVYQTTDYLDLHVINVEVELLIVQL